MAKPRRLTNAAVAELLSLEAEHATHHLQKALRRAARSAFLWPEEACDIMAAGRSLTGLQSIGPRLATLLQKWIVQPPKMNVAPNIRRGFLTFPAARTILSRHRLGKMRLRGDLQMHTKWSDGSGTIAQMAQGAAQRGYEYIAITDHAKGLKIAGGINEAELREQGDEIRRVNKTLNGSLRVLRSIELNLNPRGEGDLEPASLRSLDIVIGAFHSALRKSDDQTSRYLAALKNPAVNILAHPRGRVYNYRLGLSANWPRVFDLAAKLDKAVEIDSYPDRQDLDVDLLKLARVAGVRISIGTDAHHPWQLAFIELGLAAAAKADIPPDRILNFMPRDKLLAWARKVRQL